MISLYFTQIFSDVKQESQNYMGLNVLEQSSE